MSAVTLPPCINVDVDVDIDIDVEVNIDITYSDINIDVNAEIDILCQDLQMRIVSYHHYLHVHHNPTAYDALFAGLSVNLQVLQFHENSAVVLISLFRFHFVLIFFSNFKFN